jgi:alpha-1,3-rhamnosyl/mannosyltransferase
MRRTVVVNATAIGRRPDGISTYAVELLRALAVAECDLRFHLVVTEAARRRLDDVHLPPGWTVEWTSAALAPDRGTRGHLLRRLHAERLALRRRRDLLFALSPLEAPLQGGTRVVTVHDLLPLELPQHHPRQRHLYRWLLGPALRRAAHLIVPSRSTAEALVRRYGLPAERIRVVPHGSPVPLRAESPPAPRGFVLCIGRPDPVKNMLALLRAFVQVPERLKHGLILAGVGVRPEAWRVPLAALNGRVRFLSEALEAMSRGCPVAAARSGALPEVCGDAVEYFDPHDVGGLADLLARLLGDPGRRAELSRRGRRRAEGFSWAASARNHISVFEEALRGGRP